ncbi:exosome complex exonuclease-like protein Rrp6 [Bimuria novae-zelandiae CBS 107.79]|uniref:Exosome complex exonuclease-like protein Rrp6 n=1 Tax=Bimuria novae-zelandiae CBS 107.79 TaxID=1447943 RepID=A0A6A5V8Q7_9PLEO|nr:exosome complex exonuclease-like protein Rrp6 [Bimuria novae-zelandiae CBS 107.79]
MDFKATQEQITKALIATTRAATRINKADVPFQRSLNPAAGGALDKQNARLLQLARRLLENAATGADAVGPDLPTVEALDEADKWRGFVDVIDSLLEKADTSLDEYSGVVKRMSPGAEQATAAAAVKPRPNIAAAPSKFLPKPQLQFENVPKNNETGGFHPLLTSKPHAKVPMEQCLQTFKDKRGREQYPHPYQTEIETYEYPNSMYRRIGPKPYKPFESTTATFVDTPEALVMMLAELKTAKEIAVDLEHHDNRSYIGMVSLMQISTRDKDWIVDTLKPWRRQLECLNEVFTDPDIIKVLHGAYMDIVWLQRDLGLYVVGLFDTYHAARALGYPGGSLAYLLERFVKFQAQKQYQLADWRVRPLSKELFEYARADTHFLLYIFDNMRNELVENSDFSKPETNKMQEVLSKSKETALQRYEHPIYDPDLGFGSSGWYRLVSRTPVQFTPQQFAVFKAVHKWRDDVAREEDDSPIFIMPNHALFSIAREMPKDKAALFTVVIHVSPILKNRADELVKIVQNAKASGLNGPDLYATLQRIENIREAERASRYGTAPVPLTVAPSAPSAPAVVVQQSAAPMSLDTSALRANASQFWGGLVPQKDPSPQPNTSLPDISFALPLPPLTADVFADPAADTSPAIPVREPPKFIAKEDRPAEDARTDIFVVKHLGGSRKRKAADALASPSTSTPTSKSADPMLDDEIMLEEDEETARSREKAERKEARRAEKEARRAEKRAAKDAAENADDDEPAFDYASAPTVLHANTPGADKKKDRKGKKGKKKPANFNPYAKLADVPKGLPPKQREKAGRSKTFES